MLLISKHIFLFEKHIFDIVYSSCYYIFLSDDNILILYLHCSCTLSTYCVKSFNAINYDISIQFFHFKVNFECNN